MSQQGYGLGGVFRSAGRYVSPILGEVGKIGVTAGADLVKNLLGDVIDGKSVKEAARERGRQAGKQSLNLAGERAIQVIQSPKTPTYTTPKATKRPRSQSTGGKKKAKKAKKSQKGGGCKRKKSQKGGGRKRKKSQSGGKRKKAKGRKKAVGVVFPRAMTSKQRRSLPAKDIFG